MGMCIDVKEGESVILRDRAGGAQFSATVRVEKKNGRGVRLVITAIPSVSIVPPNKQKEITPP